jgi:hypothetical protein
LGRADLARLAMNAAEISWQPPGRKARLVEEIRAYAAVPPC